MEDNDVPDTSPPWAELPTDALSEIAGHLHEVGDFMRFHAVCRPWRQAPPPPHTRRFLPCLIEQSFFDDSQYLHLHSPFSGKLPPTRTILTLTALAGKTLECSDACSGRVFAARREQSVLINPLTGDATSFPALPETMDPMGWNRRQATGTACNGIVMFNTRMSMPCDMEIAMLRPGETDNWEEVDVTTCLDLNDTQEMDEHTCRALTLCSSGVLQGGRSAMAKLPRTKRMTRRYVVESQGELMCLDVLCTTPTYYSWSQEEANSLALISVAVHVMEVDDDGRPRWVKREHGRGIEHLCFFLNRDNSTGFSIDAREFAGGEVSGGCAYFVQRHRKKTETNVMGGAVYRYNFKDGTAAVVDVLPDGFIGIGSMWYMPQPIISAVRSRHER